MTTYRKQQLLYILTDLLTSVIVWLGFLLFRWLVYEGRVMSVDTVLIPAFGFWTPLVLYPLFCLSIYYLSGYYLRPSHKHRWQEFRTTIISALVIAVSAFFLIIIDDKVTDYHHYTFSLLVLFVLQFVLSYLPRLAISTYDNRHHEKREEILISLPDDASDKQLYARIREAYPSGKEILLVPRTRDLVIGAARIGELSDTPLIRITQPHLSDAGICIKRAGDVLLSSLALLITLPLQAVIALVVHFSSPGPVLYRQERIGLYGRPFTILKYRTMFTGAEDETPRLTLDDDPRITPAGRILRKYRLDELPQLWNIIRGDMSIVGPRPEREFFIRQIEEQAPYYCLLYKMRPGLTSMGPIRVGYTDTMDKMILRLNYDIAYMENQSLRLDLKIMFFTIGVILRGQGK